MALGRDARQGAEAEPPLYRAPVAHRGQFLLLGVQWVAQRQLNFSLGSGERKFLRIIGRNQQSDDRRQLRFAGGVALQLLAGGDDRDVLQDGGGLLVVARQSDCR